MRMNHVLVGAFVIAGTLALFGVGSRSSNTNVAIAPESAPIAPNAPMPPAVPDAVEEPVNPKVPTQSFEGKALETLDVPEYTYIRMEQKGASDIWVAVASAPVKVGDLVRFESQTIMKNFTSPKLKRTFEQIHFGTLVGQDVANAPSNPHAAAMPTEHPVNTPANDDIVIGKIEKANGPNGLRIAEVFAQKTSLSGKSARVRGVVVKVTNGVMGKNFVHLRDGSGSEAQHDDDLTVTTQEKLERGQTVLLEGTITLNKDLGAGYHYDVLLEDATRPK